MRFFVDTSVWSLAFRRDRTSTSPQVGVLHDALTTGDDVLTCGMVLLEVLRGAVKPQSVEALERAFSALTWIEPRKLDYREAAGLAATCRRNGVQLTTVDALLAQLAIAGDATMLTADKDFIHAARHIPLRVWTPTAEN